MAARLWKGEACDLTGGLGDDSMPCVDVTVSLKVNHSGLTAEDVKGLQVAL